eukprot:7375953-Prymnesium_polylepis.1
MHVFVPPSACAQQLADEAAADHEEALAAAKGQPVPSRKGKGGRKKKGKGKSLPGRRANGANETAAEAPTARPPRLWLQVATAPPTWAGMLRHATDHLGSYPPSDKRAWIVVIARADVTWPRSFGCLSPSAMKSSASVLTFSCQIHMRTCMEPKFMKGGADWATAYKRCRTSGRSVSSCAPMLDTCHKYAGVHHALAFAAPPPPPALAALHRLHA